MKIYIEGGSENDAALKQLSNELYSGKYASQGLRDFYYGFTAYTVGYERAYCHITFEVKGQSAQLAFLDLAESRFEILQVEAEEPDDEGDAIAQWESSHPPRPLPKKVTLPIVMFIVPGKRNEKFNFVEPTVHLSNMFGSYFQSENCEECLLVANKYTPESYLAAKSLAKELTREAYGEIYSSFRNAPENPEDVFDKA